MVATRHSNKAAKKHDRPLEADEDTEESVENAVSGEEKDEPKPKKRFKPSEESQQQEKTKTTTTSSDAHNIVEKGKIIFMYRPKVGIKEASELSQVQRFYVILSPDRSGARVRLGVVAKKRMPAAETHERFFGFIETVGDSMDEIVSGLGAKTYETKTRGTRHVEAARVVGEASYSIVKRGRNRTHLIIHLLVPATLGEVQENFVIPKVGSYVLSIKNPANEPPHHQIGLPQKADYTPEQMKEFGNYAWIGVSDPLLLDREKCEFLLVTARDSDIKGEVGAETEELTENSSATQCLKADEECLLNELKNDLSGKGEDAGVEMHPVETGEWK